MNKELIMAKKMPKAVLNHMKSKPAPKKSGKIPAGLAAWNKAHPKAKNAHKSYGPNAKKGK
jgi:hypothetical protein